MPFFLTACVAHQIDFICPTGSAVVYVGEAKYNLPAMITFTGNREDLRFELPTSSDTSVMAKGEIEFYSAYRPTKVDKYGRLRAVLSEELIRTVEAGGAAVFTGYSVTKQRVFRLVFGKGEIKNQ